jgi:RHS repeat-associated protein
MTGEWHDRQDSAVTCERFGQTMSYLSAFCVDIYAAHRAPWQREVLRMAARGSVVGLLVASLVFPLACGNDDGPPMNGSTGGPVEQPLPTPTLDCPAYVSDAHPEMAPLSPVKASAVGGIDGAFSASSTGSARYSIPLAVPPSRKVPQLSIIYDSQAPNGPLGQGFGVGGLSSIHRCGSNWAQDDKIRGISLSTSDHYCLDGSRLVQVDTGDDSIGTFAEYRTWPEQHIRIRGYGAPVANGFDVTYFVAHLPNGDEVHYGKSVNSRVLWRGNVTRAWHKEVEIDRSGNTIRYTYGSLQGGHHGSTTQEHVIDTITYAGFIDDDGVETLGDAVIDFEYDDDPRYGKLFYEGEEISQRMQLVRIDMRKNGLTVRLYKFGYEDDSATNKALLTRLDECAEGSELQCKPATILEWQQGMKGFSSRAINVPVPKKDEDDQFSWTVTDATGDGVVDVITSTKHPDSGVNRWFVYENAGQGHFGSPMEWFSAPFPQGFVKQWQLIPVDENGDGRIDLLLDQPDGAAWNTFRILRSVAAPSPHFELVATNIPRTSQFRASEFTVDSHSGLAVADLDADGMNDLLTCHDFRTWYGKGEYVPNDCDEDADCKPSLARWSAHLWRPGGFEATERHIEALDGVSCWTMKRFFGTVDWNADGQTDLVTAGKDGHWWMHRLDVPSLQWESTSLAMVLPNVLGVTVADDPVAKMVNVPLTKNRATQMETQWLALRALFPDLNGDGYPDLLFTGPRAANIKPFAIINEGRTAINEVNDENQTFDFPYEDLEGNAATFYLAPYARVFDYSGDFRDDLALPVGGACQRINADACYVIFESGRLGEKATAIRTDIPFENPEGESVAPQYLLRTADVNLDSMIDLVHPTVADQMFVFENKSKPNLLTSITTGRNPLDPGDPGFVPDVEIEYAPLVDGAAHAFPWQFAEQTYIARSDADNHCDYPRACLVGGHPVVKSYTLNNGQNQARTFTMHYRDGRAHRHGRGRLGFGEVETRDVDTGISTRQRFDNLTFDATLRAFPFAGRPMETTTTTPLPTMTLETTTSILPEIVPTNGGKTYFVMTRSTEKVRKEGAEALERSWSIVDDIDDFGNVLQWHSGSDGVDLGHSSTREVKNDIEKWLIGLVEKETTCSTALGETLCRTTTNKFNSRGEVYRQERAPDDTTAHLVTHFVHDKFGNVTNVIADDDFGHHREACTTYEPTGTFPWAMRNAAGHTSHIVYHPGLGVPLSTRDANGLTTKWRLDTFGRTVEERAPDGLITTITASRVKDGVWMTRVMESTPGHGARESVLNSYGRPIQLRKLGPDVDTVGISLVGKNVWIVQDNRYDFFGRREWQSIPRIDGDVVAETKGSTFEHDNAGRLTKSITPWGTTTRTYERDKVTITEPGPSGIASTSTVIESDPVGRAIATTDAKQGITRHVHGPFGALRRIELPDGTARETKQDAYGRTTYDDDPDRGKTILEFNGFDEVVKLHDAAGRHYVFERDALGRLTQRSEGLNVSMYDYDTAAHGIGLPARTTGADGHVEDYGYDHLSRLEGTLLRLADGRTFEQGQTYDEFSRVRNVEYPNGFAVVRHYDATGTLVKLTHEAKERPLWTLDMVNSAGQTMKETFGNGATTERVYDDDTNLLEAIFTFSSGKTLQSLRYAYDPQLNVKNRFDARQGKLEWFRHDALNRVTCLRVTACADYGTCIDSGGPCDVDVQYDATGSITFKSDVGVYVPDPLHPHAVQSAGGLQFVHDAVGNQIERPNATIMYADFDLPRQYIPKDGSASMTFEYSGDGARVRRVKGEEETIYLGDLYEHETKGNLVTDRFYVHNDERAIGVVERLPSGDAWRFIHPDHLGSVDVITDDAGAEVDRRSYDAWGAPRDPNWGVNGPASQNVSTRRGFTWHEWDDDVKLVNAKGRIYDPVIARFLQTDPVIADLLDAQTVNPYSYAFNRPLVFTDPDGFDAEPVSVLIYGGGSPAYAAPDHAQLVLDEQKTWLMQWPRQPPATPMIVQAPAAADHAPSAPERVGPSDLTPAEQVAYGAGERAVELAPELALGVLTNFVGAPSGGHCVTQLCSGQADGTRLLDEVNQANPLYVGALDVVKGADAHEKGDYVGVGRAGMGLVTTVVMTAITLKGARATRGPPKAAGESGTVWDHITATQPECAGTAVPKSFEVTAGGSRFWVHPNATKHMAEFITRNGTSHMQMNSQAMLTSFQASVEAAVRTGVQYGKPMQMGRWELIFSAGRPGDALPVIKHALYR